MIGNLQETVDEVEKLLFCEDRINEIDMAKENLPFDCIINPPRHGKSLFLDSIFKKRNDVVVIPMTYNNSNLTDIELHSTSHALFSFWLRFIGSVTGTKLTFLQQQSPADSSHPIGGYKYGVIYSLDCAKKIILQKYNRNPFVDAVSKRPLHLVIAVDEFSKLTTDRMSEKKWPKKDVLEFFSSLNNEKQLNPLVQFVFTGFNKEMSSCWVGESGANLQCKSLSLCDFSSAKCLLKEIVKEYAEKKSALPMLLYETVKSTPGLVGLWAERVFKLHALDSSLSTFTETLPWIKSVCNLKSCFGKTTSAVEENWSLIVKYLRLSELADEGLGLEETEMEELGDKLVSNLIGVIQRTKQSDVMETTQTLLSPFCFVCIALSGYTPTVPLEIELMTCIQEALHCCNNTRPVRIHNNNNNNGKSDGVHFEKFVTSALSTRIITRRLANPLQEWVTFRLSSLFPADVPSFVDTTTSPLGMSCTLHGIASKSSLAKMLTSPLYYLFPLGLEELDRVEAESPSEIISDLVRGAGSNHQISDISILCCSKRCKTPIQVVSKALLDSPELIKLSPEEQKIISHSDSAPTDQRKEVLQIWNSMQGWVDTIMQNHMDCSIFPLAKGAAGCDLVLLCRDAAREGCFHLVALELKDSRNTKYYKDWQDKWNMLTSYRSIVPRLRAALLKENKTLEYHIIFAGRECDNKRATEDVNF